MGTLGRAQLDMHLTAGERSYLLKPDVGTARVLSDPTRIRILEILEEQGEANTTQLAEALGVSKATVSHHMKILQNAGIVEVVRTEGGSGIPKKYYALRVGVIEKLGRGVEAQKSFERLLHGGKLRRTLGDEVNLHFLRLYMSALLQAGIDADDVLYDTGYWLGSQVMAEMVEGRNLEEVLTSIAKVWKRLKLGVVEVEVLGENAKLRVEECYQCMHMPAIGKPLCSSDGGVIAGILEKKLGRRFSVREVKCWGTGEERCEFEIREIKEEEG